MRGGPEEDEDRRDWWKLAALLAAVVVVWLLSWLLMGRSSLSSEGRAQFGDSFGAVNSLFSGLAFAGVIFAIYLQRKELRLQRRELQLQRREIELQRDEMRGQREQLEAQNATFKQDAFDSKFFHLLELHNQIVGSLTVTTSHAYYGRDCFPVFKQQLQSYVDGEARGRGANAGLSTDQEAIRGYGRYYTDSLESRCGHYFRSLHNILRFVERHAEVDQLFYVETVRDLLSVDEKAMLFYHATSADSEFRTILLKYAVLRDVPIGALLSESHQTWELLSRAGRASK